MLDERETTVYKRALDVEYKLKLKASRQVLSEVNKKSPYMPFTLRALEGTDDLSMGSLRLGLVECLSHGLMHPYPVLHEKPGELTAQVGRGGEGGGGGSSRHRSEGGEDGGGGPLRWEGRGGLWHTGGKRWGVYGTGGRIVCGRGEPGR